ncbi:hypothetical protein [Haloferula sp.]|uniref:hypothetical protein n=1 Tax=Haloferula sp. TaxID=2497595 RepID=UPI00329B18C3
MKSRILSMAAVGTLILATAALSDPLTEEPKKPEPLEQRARLAVHHQVLNAVVPVSVHFSRSGPSQEFRYKTEFEPQTLVKGETRIPFRVYGVAKESEIPSLAGYFDASDELVYVLDEKLMTFVVAANHPVIKEKSRRGQPIQLIPLMPQAATPVAPKPPLAEKPL